MTTARRAYRPPEDSVISSLANVLHAPGPDPERQSKLALYAWLVGQWKTDVTTIAEDGTSRAANGEIHAGWVLRGRAIQDVWMIPRLADRRPGIAQLPGAGNWYGTTLRVYDPGLDACPATNFFSQQVWRARRRYIVQEGPDPRGGHMRWTCTEIKPDSFHWAAEHSADSVHWRKVVDIRARSVS